MNWLGDIAAENDIDKSINHYNETMRLTKAKTEKKTLSKEIEWLKRRKTAGNK
jgi:hypothetical protein